MLSYTALLTDHSTMSPLSLTDTEVSIQMHSLFLNHNLPCSLYVCKWLASIFTEKIERQADR
jgi:hypothetical protein